MKVRQDAWSHEDDLLLAETVLRYIREGGTQLGAFEEVGDALNRTSAACGFRWNAEVRKQYEQAIAIAKKQRKERKRALENAVKQTVEINNPPVENSPQADMIIENRHSHISAKADSLSLDDCIAFLSTLKQQDQLSGRMQIENKQLQIENEKLVKENKELEKKLTRLTEQQAMIQEDYQSLVKIMDRARKLVLFDEIDERQTPTFKMDKNGNLEQMANMQ